MTTSQIDSGYTQTDELLDNLTKQMALLAQSFRANLLSTNNQLKPSNTPGNQETIQDARVQFKKAHQNIDGDELFKPHHVPVIISTSEEELELAEATRNKLHVKMNDSILWKEGVKGALAASKSKPRSNTKKDRTLPAKSALKQVEAHSRMNKSNEKHKNRVDSSISYKRTWRPTGRILPLGDQWPLTRNTPPKVLPTKQWKPTGRLLPLGRQCPLVRSTALKSDCLPADPQETIAPVAYNLACTDHSLGIVDSGCFKTYELEIASNATRLQEFSKKFNWTSSNSERPFGEIMGYGGLFLGDSVIS
ncbi:hypothetical protein Tco_0596208 [Tanacetum coccineum]